MSLLHTRRFSRWASGHLLCRVEGVDDRFALTFDDGPGRVATTPILRDMGVTPVLGDVYPDDASNPGSRRIARVALRLVRGGSILILHDGSLFPLITRMQTFRALEVILAASRERGLTAVTMVELENQVTVS
jgi:peptidoglycan/xylan/chitin deacetylase (PgdA/CDA1 family)